MKSARLTALSLMALTALAACSSQPAAKGASAAAPVAAPASSQPPASAQPPAAAATPASGGQVTGTVLETMDASNYTYVRVKTGSKELWAAASQFKVAVGETVVLSLDQPMENFHSAALNRDFPVIYFVSRIGTEGKGTEGDARTPALAVAHGGEQSPAKAAPPAPVTTAMEPVAGGMTVAALWKDRLTLAGKKVTVRGKVMKYNGGILGVNWMHLQDGTGVAAEANHDITVTSEAEAQLGEVITVTGTVSVNKDLGSGYTYAVIVEHASIARK